MAAQTKTGDALKIRVHHTALAFLLWILPAGMFLAPACAQTAMVQYVATVWQTEQGLPQNSVHSIAQDREGYLWVGTGGGLARFDGVRFKVFGADDIPGFRATLFLSLHASALGDLWIGGNNGVTRFHDGVFTTVATSTVTALREDRAGKIWISSLKGVACCAGEEAKPYTTYRGKAVREFLLQARDGSMWFRSENEVVRFGADGSVSSLPGGTMAGEGRDGTIWIAAASRLVRYYRGAFSDVPLPAASSRKWISTGPWESQLGRAADSGQVVLAMAPDLDGELLLLTPNGLVRAADGKLGDPEFLPLPAGVSGTVKVHSLFVDHEGNRWVGTLGQGLFRFRRAPLTSYAKAEGLSDSPFRTVFEDRQGRIWLGGDDSVYWFDGRFHLLPGLSQVNAIAQTRDGDLWFGGSGAVHRWRSGALTRYPLDTPAVNQLLVDREGTLWVDALNRILWRDLFRFREARFEKTDSDVLQIAEDAKGGLWLASHSPPRLLYRRAGKTIEYGRGQGVPQAGVTAMCPDSNGDLWFATASGLHRLRNGRVASITARNGLTTDVVGIFVDAQNVLWAPSNRGIMRLTLDEANDLADGKLSAIPPLAYGLSEGMKISECNSGSPGAVRARDGRLWFPTMRGVVAIDPSAVALPPPVIVEEAWAGRAALVTGGHTRAPAGKDAFEFRFTALDLSAPERQRFKYRLDPYDKDWVEAGTVRTARYTNMAPGEYSFHVIAANSFGIWNGRGATVSFALQPHYYQTNWFRFACVAAFGLLLWLAYQFRIRQLQQLFNMRLEERVRERTRIARELHDTLLQTSQAALIHMQAAYNLLARRREEAAEVLQQAINVSETGIAEGRQAIQNMRLSTVIKNDLARAVRLAGDQIAAQGSATFEVSVEGSSRNLHPILRDEIYNIALEAMRNAFRHSEAHAIEARIFYGDSFRLRIRDDGKGMDAAIVSQGRSGHYGLAGMRERAARIGGKLDVCSRPGGGTEIDLSIPGAIAFGVPAAGSLFRRFRRNNKSKSAAQS